MLQEYFLEGAFRNVHTRLRTHAESIAFFGGGEREGKSIRVIFNNLLAHLRAVVDIRQDSKNFWNPKPLVAAISCDLTMKKTNKQHGRSGSTHAHSLADHGAVAEVDIRVYWVCADGCTRWRMTSSPSSFRTM